jgi:hypothetical protein
MATDKERFSASVRPETLETLNQESEDRNLNRSRTIEQIVDEWQQPDTPDWARRVDTMTAIVQVSFVALVLSMLLAITLPVVAFVAPSVRPQLIQFGVAFQQLAGAFLVVMLATNIQIGRLRKEYEQVGYAAQLGGYPQYLAERLGLTEQQTEEVEADA